MQDTILKALTNTVESMDVSQASKVFATMSRYTQSDEAKGDQLKLFDKFKVEVKKRLTDSTNKLNIHDMVILSMPLAAEEVKD